MEKYTLRKLQSIKNLPDSFSLNGFNLVYQFRNFTGKEVTLVGLNRYDLEIQNKLVIPPFHGKDNEFEIVLNSIDKSHDIQNQYLIQIDKNQLETPLFIKELGIVLCYTQFEYMIDDFFIKDKGYNKGLFDIDNVSPINIYANDPYNKYKIIYTIMNGFLIPIRVDNNKHVERHIEMYMRQSTNSKSNNNIRILIKDKDFTKLVNSKVYTKNLLKGSIIIGTDPKIVLEEFRKKYCSDSSSSILQFEEDKDLIKKEYENRLASKDQEIQKLSLEKSSEKLDMDEEVTKLNLEIKKRDNKISKLQQELEAIKEKYELLIHHEKSDLEREKLNTEKKKINTDKKRMDINKEILEIKKDKEKLSQINSGIIESLKLEKEKAISGKEVIKSIATIIGAILPVIVFMIANKKSSVESIIEDTKSLLSDSLGIDNIDNTSILKESDTSEYQPQNSGMIDFIISKMNNSCDIL